MTTVAAGTAGRSDLSNEATRIGEIQKTCGFVFDVFKDDEAPRVG